MFADETNNFWYKGGHWLFVLKYVWNSMKNGIWFQINSILLR